MTIPDEITRLVDAYGEGSFRSDILRMLSEQRVLAASRETRTALLAAIERAIAAPTPAIPAGFCPIETAPKDRTILVWCPPYHGLPPLVCLAHWHEDAGFCVDELREPTHWAEIQYPHPHQPAIPLGWKLVPCYPVAWQYLHNDPISGKPTWHDRAILNGSTAKGCRPLYAATPEPPALSAEGGGT